MNILLTGATGLLGRALCSALLAQGHRLTVLSRRAERVPALCGASVRAWRSLDDWTPGNDFDAIVNLAGAPIIDLPWSAARKERLWQSRVELTRQLVAAIKRAEHPPGVLLSASAIGYYGDRGETACSDKQPCASQAEDFGARLCAAWEAAASDASGLGVRVCLLRTGLVLSSAGGLLRRLRLPFSLGLGGRLGQGQQWMSWIQLDDWVGAVLHLLHADALQGPFNLVAPHAVRNAEFTAALAAALHRPACLPVPAPLLQLLLGERAYLLLGGQRILPDRLLESGYRFRYDEIHAALRASL